MLRKTDQVIAAAVVGLATGLVIMSAAYANDRASTPSFGVGGPPSVGVVGGDRFKKGQYSFVVALRRKIDRKPFCTGSVVGDRWILTANHCFYIDGKEITTDSYSIWTGRNLEEGKEFAVDKVIHYDLNSLDLSLIKLKTPIVSDAVVIVPIASGPTPSVGTAITGVGWGLTAWGGDPTTSPKWLTRLSNLLITSDCVGTAAQFCVAFPRPKGLTFGDSGSPALIGSVTSPTLIGVCNSSNQVDGLYTRSDRFYRWVQKTILDN
jgi:hypothetical protein